MTACRHHGFVRSAVLLFSMAFWSSPAFSQSPCCETITLKKLVRMDCEQLAALYRQLPPACLETGYYEGRAIYKAGSPITVPAAGAIRVLWQGKHIDMCQLVMTNKVLGGKGVRAAIYEGVSYMDGGPSLIMDYGPFGSFAANARDEVREVAPGLYLGAMYIHKKCGAKFSMFFALKRNDCGCE